MKRSRSRLTTVLLIFLILFFGLIIYLLYFQLVKADDLRQNPLNMRNTVNESQFARGLFYDRQGRALYTRRKKDDGTFVRYANHPYLYSHIIGYNSPIYGKSGLEATYNRYLLNISEDDPISKLQGAILGHGVGNDVYLTIDDDLQAMAYNGLEGKKGAVICMNPKTGEILAMASRPSFDLNTLDQNWQTYVEDDANAPLYDRAGMGLYPPGSTMKVVTSLGILQEGVDLDYFDDGTAVINGFSFKNYNDRAFGSISLREALIYSANTYFADKIQEVSPKKMQEVADACYFNKKIPFDIPVKMSRAEYKSSMDDTLLGAQAFGQGEILASPLNMLMVYSAIGNGGEMVQPRLVDRVQKPEGEVLKETSPKVISELDPEDCKQVSSYLKDVAQQTGFTSQVPYVVPAGKTGTADSKDNQLHAWYAGYAPADDPTFAVVVLVENGGHGGEVARPIAGQLMNYWFSR